MYLLTLSELLERESVLLDRFTKQKNGVDGVWQTEEVDLEGM